MNVPSKLYAPSGVELRRGRVDRQRDVLAGSESGLADRLDDEIERGPVVLEVGGEGPSSPVPVGSPRCRLITDFSVWLSSAAR